MTRHDVVEHRSADHDRAHIKDANEHRQREMHDVRPPEQGEGEGNAGEADLPDRYERAAGIAGRNSRDVAHDAAADEDFDVGPGMHRQGIGAGQADKGCEAPCSQQRAKLPALDQPSVRRIVRGAVIGENQSAAPGADDGEAQEKVCIESVAGQNAGYSDDHERRDRRAEYRFRRAVKRANQLEIEQLVGDRAVQPIEHSDLQCGALPPSHEPSQPANVQVHRCTSYW